MIKRVEFNDFFFLLIKVCDHGCPQSHCYNLQLKKKSLNLGKKRRKKRDKYE